MLNNKKKGNISLVFGTVLLFSLISVLWIFLTYFIFAIGNDYVVYNLEAMKDQTDFSDQIKDGFTVVAENYQETNLDVIDNTFLLSYLMLIISSITVAYRGRGLNYFGFLNMMTYGVMLLLFILGIVGVITEYIYTDIMLNMFDNLVISLPMFAYFIDHMYLLALLHFVGLLMVMVIDLDFSTILSRRKKERVVLEQQDEII